MKCPKCKKEWKDDCEQSWCIEKYGECFACLALGEREDWDEILDYIDECYKNRS
jgi:hypothetical protein